MSMAHSTLLDVVFRCVVITVTWATLANSQSCLLPSTACEDEDINTKSFLGQAHSIVPYVRVSCLNRVPLEWSQSPDGISANHRLLDTASDKYVVETPANTSLLIKNISSSDEGLYKCVYQQGGSEDKVCILVYGRAVFASCPQDLVGGCSGDPESVSVTAGESAAFNATVIHIFGGSCGLLQSITNVKLVKKNDRFVSSDVTLRSCMTQRDGTLCTDSSIDRVVLDRGNNLGFEFVFTLSNVTTSDAGMYEVVVTTNHPGTGNDLTISKSFTLQVVPSTAPPTINTTTPIPTTSGSTATSTPTTTADDVTQTKATPSQEALGDGSDSLMLPIIAGISVVVFIVAVVAAVIIFIIVIRHIGWPRKSKDGNTLVEDGPDIVILRRNGRPRVVADGAGGESTSQVVPPPFNTRPPSHVSLVPEPDTNLPKLDLDGQEFRNV